MTLVSTTADPDEPQAVAATEAAASATSEMTSVPQPLAVRRALMSGLRTGQLAITDGVAVLSDTATASFICVLADAVQDPITRSPLLSAAGVRGSAFEENLDRSMSDYVAAYVKELAAAERAINAKYADVGGFLGAPTSGIEFGGHSYDVAFRKYEHGAIYVPPQGAAFEVHGAIYQKYVGLAAEAGYLGFPESDEQSTANGEGRFNTFHGGSIFWSQASGARAIHGPIRDRWLQLQAERSYLGFPVSDVEPTLQSGGEIGHASYFQNGNLELQSDGAVEDYPESVRIEYPVHGGYVKCSIALSMNSLGDWHYTGHTHNAGFLGCVAIAATSPQFQDAGGRVFAVAAERSLGGTMDRESRNDDWDEVGNDPFIRDNWPFIRSAGAKTVLKTRNTVADVLTTLWPIALAAMVIGAASTKKWCGPYASVTRDPTTGENASHFGFILVEPGEQCPPQPGEPIGSP
ncbi:MAG: hypothetical protein V7607_2577 [Solirubrobacteraceae bacterium]